MQYNCCHLLSYLVVAIDEIIAEHLTTVVESFMFHCVLQLPQKVSLVAGPVVQDLSLSVESSYISAFHWIASNAGISLH